MEQGADGYSTVLGVTMHLLPSLHEAPKQVALPARKAHRDGYGWLPLLQSFFACSVQVLREFPSRNTADPPREVALRLTAPILGTAGERAVGFGTTEHCLPASAHSPQPPAARAAPNRASVCKVLN